MPLNETPNLGQRLQSIRKRRGLSQRELAQLSAVSLGHIRKIEQGERPEVRLQTLRKLAIALRVATTSLITTPDADQPDRQTLQSWEPVRRALLGQTPQPDEAPTAEATLATLNDIRPALALNRYSQVQAILPAMLRDAEALNGHAPEIRSRVLNLTGWLLVQTRQWDMADAALSQATDLAADRLDAAAAINTMVWSRLRQGELAQARDLATRWSDNIEPRFSRATPTELGLWGRLLLGVSNAAIRDNRPGEANDAIRLARAAADRIGREITSDNTTTRTFGPITVAMIHAENAALNDQPDRVLSIAQTIPDNVLHPSSASRCRHRLDVASALTQLRRYPEAIAILQRLQQDAPEWLPQQRYARDILGHIIDRRRTLTPVMRNLADFIGVTL